MFGLFKEKTTTLANGQKESIASKENYNDVFWREGWALNRGRKYEHLCYVCLPKKQQKAIDNLKARGF